MHWAGKHQTWAQCQRHIRQQSVSFRLINNTAWCEGVSDIFCTTTWKTKGVIQSAACAQVLKAQKSTMLSPVCRTSRTGSWFSLCEEKKCNEIFIDSFTSEINSHVLHTPARALHVLVLHAMSTQKYTLLYYAKYIYIFFIIYFIYSLYIQHPQKFLWYHNDEIKDWRCVAALYYSCADSINLISIFFYIRTNHIKIVYIYTSPEKAA